MDVIRVTTPLLSAPRATEAQCVAYIVDRAHGEYNQKDVESIVAAYFSQASGLDPLLAIAQMVHETGNLNAALAQRKDKDGNPLRNPAGLGVDGSWSNTPKAGYVWDADRNCYRACCGFTSWAGGSVPAHLGRLLAYALAPGKENAEQLKLVNYALHVRPLPLKHRGVARMLSGLNARWAKSPEYVNKIVDIANSICSIKL